MLHLIRKLMIKKWKRF